MTTHEPAYDDWCVRIEGCDDAELDDTAAFEDSLFATEPKGMGTDDDDPFAVAPRRVAPDLDDSHAAALLVKVLNNICRLPAAALATVRDQAAELLRHQDEFHEAPHRQDSFQRGLIENPNHGDTHVHEGNS